MLSCEDLPETNFECMKIYQEVRSFRESCEDLPEINLVWMYIYQDVRSFRESPVVEIFEGSPGINSAGLIPPFHFFLFFLVFPP
jgi:hypothetical protein